MNIGARNMLPGKVHTNKPGAVNLELRLTLADKQEIVAVITNKRVDHLGLKISNDNVILAARA